MLFELQIVPVGSSAHLSDVIARCVRLIQDAKLPYVITPSGTVRRYSMTQHESGARRHRFSQLARPSSLPRDSATAPWRFTDGSSNRTRTR